MAIKINDIPPEGLAIELAEKLDLFNEGTAATACAATFTIKPAGSGIFHITGRVQAEPELECSRCLTRFPFRIEETNLSFDLIPKGSFKTASEHELGRAELDMEFYRGDEIEPRDLVKEQLLLSIPMVPLHSPDCKGLCPICGADLNQAECGCRKDSKGEAEPFSVLKDIFKK